MIRHPNSYRAGTHDDDVIDDKYVQKALFTREIDFN